MIVLQEISKTLKDEQDLFEKYFLILTAMNSIHLPPAELRLLAFTARKGGISSGGLKNQFCQLTNYPKASLGNLIHKLTKKGWLIKQEDRIIINPIIKISSCSGIKLKLTLNANQGYSNTEDSN